jgi:hypothetical protein
MNVAGEQIIMMTSSDHREICRFPNATDDSYLRVLRVLQEFVNDAVNSML